MSQATAATAQGVPSAIGPYSHGVKVGPLLFASGQLPLDANGQSMPDAIESQAKLVLENLDRVARAGGSSLSCAVKLTVYMTDLREFAQVNEVMAATFHNPSPPGRRLG
jgi:2-iminobutanoate/2-iminopropanoate deaminase